MPVHITPTLWFFHFLKKVGSILSWSELDPFLYMVSKRGLTPVYNNIDKAFRYDVSQYISC